MPTVIIDRSGVRWWRLMVGYGVVWASDGPRYVRACACGGPTGHCECGRPAPTKGIRECGGLYPDDPCCAPCGRECAAATAALPVEGGRIG